MDHEDLKLQADGLAAGLVTNPLSVEVTTKGMGIFQYSFVG